MDISITQITLATTNTEAMQAFYNVVFGAKFISFEMHGHNIYEGEIGGITFTLVPNALLNVEASKNRFQFDFSVPDVEKWLQVALAFGGRLDGDEGVVEVNGKRFASILDPDGNALVVMQKTGEKAVEEDDSAARHPTEFRTMLHSRGEDDIFDDSDADFVFGGRS